MYEYDHFRRFTMNMKISSFYRSNATNPQFLLAETLAAVKHHTYIFVGDKIVYVQSH